MPNKVCWFGCNKTKKLSVVVTPKWLDALSIKHLDTNDVICEQHFLVDSIKKQNYIVDKLGNIVCSVSKISITISVKYNSNFNLLIYQLFNPSNYQLSF